MERLLQGMEHLADLLATGRHRPEVMEEERHDDYVGSERQRGEPRLPTDRNHQSADHFHRAGGDRKYRRDGKVLFGNVRGRAGNIDELHSARKDEQDDKNSACDRKSGIHRNAPRQAPSAIERVDVNTGGLL